MSDLYQTFSSSAVGQLFVKYLGIPNPAKLERYSPDAPVINGSVITGGTGEAAAVITEILNRLGVASTSTFSETSTYKGAIFDATNLTSPDQLSAVQEFITPLVRKLSDCSRVIIVGTLPTTTESSSAHITQRALEGITRSFGKEIGNGSTVNLVYVTADTVQSLSSTIEFFLSPRSAYVSGQVARLGLTGAVDPIEVADTHTPLVDKVAVVTGASRGIGLDISAVLHRQGATVVGVDIPAAAGDLHTAMDPLAGHALSLDITAPDAPQRMAHYVKENFDGIDIVVHNAGITRDRKLANMSPERWQSVLSVNLLAPTHITEELLAQELVNPNGRLIGVSSIAGIAGNVGQTNYAASKAGVIGWVDALAPHLPDGITVNAVAPGFIITKMTAAVPFATREVGQRLNAMAQGGLPVDVAETIAWFAHPSSNAVNGNVVRVCGQMMLGA